MVTGKGVYENGEVRLLETPPVSGKQTVLITFVEENEEEQLRQLSLSHHNDFFKSYLEDKREDLYQDYLKEEDEDR